VLTLEERGCWPAHVIYMRYNTGMPPDNPRQDAATSSDNDYSLSIVSGALPPSCES